MKVSIPPRLVSLLIALTAVLFFSGQRAAAQAPQTFTITGTVTDNTGHAMADALIIVVSDVTGTQLAFTDQSGNYALTYTGGVSHRLSM
jgi:glutamate synthase domain-containing protein 3